MCRHAAVRQTPRCGGKGGAPAAVSDPQGAGSCHSRGAPRRGQYSLHNPAGSPSDGPLTPQMELCCARALESLYSTQPKSSQPSTILEAVVHPSFGRYARKHSRALLCAAAIFAAGCHHNSYTSGFGIAWVTVTDTPGDFTSYIVNVDSVSLTGKVSGLVTPVTAIEPVDFTKLDNVSELYDAASVPNDTYTSASIVLDY